MNCRIAFAAGLVLAAGVAAAEDLVIADFEGETYAPWEVKGEAFGSAPARGPLPGQMNVEGFQGRGLVNSFSGGDDATGVLVSPPFQVVRQYVSFLIGGGKNDESLALQLLVDGVVVRRATGGNDSPGGSESLASGFWDVSDLAGKSAVVRIVDAAKGGWGHLNVDQIVQTDTKPKGFLKDVERSFPATTRFLHLPIRNGAPKRKVTLLVDGQVVVRNDIELADGAADWWAPMDVAAWKGRSLTLRVDTLHEDSAALRSIEPGDTLKGAESLYREPLRGQFHFSPRRGWNNDPNGLVYANGEYHLFFQHNPYGWSWGNMHWGHAVSKDMVHWEELGDVLSPDEMGPMFSGSAVVDWKNTSGFGTQGAPPIVLIYTAAGDPTVQGLAYSTDGRNFTKYKGNPVLPQITPGNRDPKVFWHEPTQRWVMVLYVEWQRRHTIHFFTSPNLKEWTLASRTEGDAPGSGYLFECPDFFELPVDGDPTRTQWVLLAANMQYALGSFDGRTFTPSAERLPGLRGRGVYAPQTFSDIPADDGRRILIGWWQTETRGMPFNQSMTVPIELKLATTPEGPRLSFSPIRELTRLRTRSHRFDTTTLSPGDANPLDTVNAELLEVRFEFDPGKADAVALNIRGVPVEYDSAKQEIRVAGHTAPAPLIQGKQRLIVYCDRTGLEVFASGGLCYLPLPLSVDPENRHLKVEARGGPAHVSALEVHELQPAWPRP